MSDRVYLPDNVFFCATGSHGIFLDLGRDTYSAVVLAPAAGASEDDGILSERLGEHRNALVDGGLLTRDVRRGSPLSSSLRIDRPATHLFGIHDTRHFGISGNNAADIRLSARDVFDFTLSFAEASCKLKRQPIMSVVAAVRERQKRAGEARDLPALCQATAIFCRLRPWYPKSYLCMRDALALLEFLARRKLHASWIFGVRMMPFGAHCWLQAGDALLNDDREYASAYTPIMCV